MKIHILEIDELCRKLNAGRIPSNYSDESQPEQEYYKSDEYFIIERYDGTPMSVNYSGLLSAASIGENNGDK
jgi:hypothetical protein